MAALAPLLLPLLAFGALGQLTPELPKLPIKDLQLDGEWWFYALLDSQFPHDLLKPLPADTVARSAEPGSPLILDLPRAEYVLLEFFAPWCPHCQALAPEMEKVVGVLQHAKKCSPGGEGCGPLVAVRTVDCEKVEMSALCSWAQAYMLPRLVLARREVLLRPVAAFSNVTQDVAELFPVGEASDVITFLTQEVADWPSNLPTPAPPPSGAPFLGWPLPPAGAAEPPQAPLQDLMVAAAALLHEAFSTVRFNDQSKAGLFDLLGLLCAAGPSSGACRQSACEMRNRLQRDWEQVTYSKTLTVDYSGNPITPPVTALFANWSRIEHEHQWCDVPWPHWAQAGWSWCRGQNVGTRGYTCGLWMLFHSLLAGSADAASAASRRLMGLETQPLEVVRSTVRHFFGCQVCRDHFLSIPVTDADLASLQAQSLWLWRAHNNATARVGAEEQEHSSLAPRRHQWPTRSVCPQCRGGDGSWQPGEVYSFLKNFYGPGQAAAQLDGLVSEYQVDTRVDPLVVSVQVFYFTLCPHCLFNMRLGVMPLVEALLPGDRVKLTVLPLYPPMLRYIDPDSREGCHADDSCRLAMAPLCALRGVVQPGPADSPELLRGARFAACDISHTARGSRTDEEGKACAEKAGLQWDGPGGIKDCSEGPEAFQLLKKSSELLYEAMRTLHDGDHFQEPPSMPWIFLDGKLLFCDDGRICPDIQTPEGNQHIDNAGTLLELVCRRLSPSPPEACANVAKLQLAAEHKLEEDVGGAGAEHRAEEQAKACENCAEVGHFRWRPGTTPAEALARAATPAAGVVCASAAAAALALAAWRRRYRRCEFEDLGDGLESAAE